MVSLPRNSTGVLFAIVLSGAVLSGCQEKPPEKYIESAKSYLAANDPRAATIQLKNAIAQNPNLPEARFLLGKALLESGDPGSALIELEKAKALGFPGDLVIPAIARSLLAQGRYKQVTEGYSSVQLGSPSAVADLGASLTIGYLEQKDLAQAEKALSKALKADPESARAKVIQARLLANKSDFQEALAALEQVLSKDPKNLEALELKGAVLAKSGNSTAAIDAYRAVLAIRKDHLNANAAIGSLYISTGDYKSARGQLEILKEKRPNDPATQYFEARLAFAEGDPKKSAELTQQILKTYPNNAPALQLAGLIAYRTNSFIQAESHLIKALQQAPDSWAIRALLAGTYIRTHQSDKALQVLRPALDSENPTAEAFSLAGQAYAQEGNFVSSKKMFSKAVALNPDDTTSRLGVALSDLSADPASSFKELESIARSDSSGATDLSLIHALLAHSDTKRALLAIARLEEKQPGKPFAATLRGKAMLLQGDALAARKSFERASNLDPRYFPATDGLVNLDLKDRKPDLAAQRLATFLEREPGNVSALLALSRVRAESGSSIEEVIGPVATAIKLNPSEPAPRLVLISLRAKNKDFQGALTAAQDAAAAIPDTPDILNALARAQFDAGDVNQAISSFKKLAVLQPTSARPHLELAKVYAASGDSEAASQSVSRALTLEPEDLSAQRRAVQADVSSGRIKEALSKAREVQAQHPTKAAGFLLEGDIHVAAKNFAAASAAYQNALTREPTTRTAQRLHTSLLAAGKVKEADVLASTWLAKHPADVQFLFHLGNLALLKKNYGAAEEYYLRLLKLQPENTRALNNLAWAMHQQKKPGAIAYAEKANEIRPNDPKLMGTWAILLAETGEVSRALELQKRAVSAAPNDHALRLTLAKIYLKAGNKELARAELERLKGLGASFPAHMEVDALLKQASAPNASN